MSQVAAPDASARDAGLRYVTVDSLDIARTRKGEDFSYLPKPSVKQLDRIRTLAIPPAWTEVRIAARPDSHLQAVGRDARGRLQYLYHPLFREARDLAKYDRLADFAAVLPHIRQVVAGQLRRRGHDRDKVLAAVVWLLDVTGIRVGNTIYSRQNRSHGLTTLKPRHVSLAGDDLRFRFKGKSGKEWRLKLHDRRIARVVRDCQDIPGQTLFTYRDDDGDARAVDSADINAFLQETSGRDITAKDFRTWTGTVLAATYLAEWDPTVDGGLKPTLKGLLKGVSAHLGNTPAVCRKCYVHPAVLELVGDEEGRRAFRRAVSRARAAEGCSEVERAVLALLRRWAA